MQGTIVVVISHRLDTVELLNRSHLVVLITDTLDGEDLDHTWVLSYIQAAIGTKHHRGNALVRIAHLIAQLALVPTDLGMSRETSKKNEKKKGN